MVNCSVLGCSSNSARQEENVTFHQFPKNETMRSYWTKATGRQNWQPTKYTRICSKHFEAQLFRKTKCTTQLREGSIPTINVMIASEPQAAEAAQVAADVNARRQNVVGSSSSLINMAQSKEVPLDVTPRKRKLTKELKKQLMIAQARKKKINQLRCKKWRLEKKTAQLRSVIEELQAKHLINQETADVLLAINPLNKEILKRVTGISTGKQYSPEIRKFALSLHFISPRAYNFVRKTFDTCLPHTRTLTRWYQSIDGEPGFTKESLEALKLLSRNSPQKLYGALCFDEMAIRKCVQWDGNNYIGFVNCGNNIDSDSLPVAKDALVFMLTCINGTWKLPIGYFNVDGVTAEQKAALVSQALDLLEESGINVSSVTFDGCAANISMARILGCKLDVDDIENVNTTFMHNNNKVVIFPDPSHMLKLVRNTLGDKQTIENGEGQIISWHYVERLVEIQENEGFHLGNKLTKAHINFKKQIMKVKLAAQVLSESVADALEFCRDQLNLEEFAHCGATVEFIRKFNALFDLMNSRNLRAYGYKRPLSERNFESHKTFLASMYDYIKKIKFEGIGILRGRRKTGFLGFIMCTKSLIALYKELVETGKIVFLCSYKLSQDHLEYFFSAIRAKCGFNNNPTARQFQAAYKRMLVHGELKHITSGNTVPLENITILTCTQPEVSLNRSTIANIMIIPESGDNIEVISKDHNYIVSYTPENTDPDDLSVIPQDHNYLADPTVLTEFTREVIIYIAGFVVRKLEAQLKCHTCLSGLISAEPFQSLQMKKDKGGLKYPSKSVITVCEVAEKVYRQNKTFGKKNPLNDLLCSCLKKCINLNSFNDISEHFTEQCISENHYALLIKSICKKYLNTRMYHAAKKVVNDNDKVRNFYNKLVLFKGQ